MRTAFPSSLVGRYSYDYYGASVTLGLAPLRCPTFVLCSTADLGVPSSPLMPSLGMLSPSEVARPQSSSTKGAGRLQRAIPADGPLHSSGMQDSVSNFRHIHGPPPAPPHTHGHDRAFRILGPVSFHIK